MNRAQQPKGNHRKIRTKFTRQIAAKESRKLRARQSHNQNLWFGLGLLGLVGWSIVVPTLLGLALGVWIDRRFPSQFSWTIMLMVAGLGLGCLNAWSWVNREQAILAQSEHKLPPELPSDDAPKPLPKETNHHE